MLEGLTVFIQFEIVREKLNFFANGRGTAVFIVHRPDPAAIGVPGAQPTRRG